MKVTIARGQDLVVYGAALCVVVAVCFVFVMLLPADARAWIPFLPRWMRW